MCLDRGRKPTVADFQRRVYQRNLDHLTIWHNIGRDVEHGIWAIAGARMGTHSTMLTDWDYTQVQWFDALEAMWEQSKNCNPDDLAASVAKDLRTQLDLLMNDVSADVSKFFKHHYRSNWHNRGVMTREMDIIRSQEGW